MDALMSRRYTIELQNKKNKTSSALGAWCVCDGIESVVEIITAVVHLVIARIQIDLSGKNQKIVFSHGEPFIVCVAARSERKR